VPGASWKLTHSPSTYRWQPLDALLKWTSSVAAGFGRHGMPPPICNFDLWPLDIETGVRLACKMRNLHSKFGHSRPLGSLIICYIGDGQTDRQRDGKTDGPKQRLLSLPTVGGIINWTGWNIAEDIRLWPKHYKRCLLPAHGYKLFLRGPSIDCCMLDVVCWKVKSRGQVRRVWLCSNSGASMFAVPCTADFLVFIVVRVEVRCWRKAARCGNMFDVHEHWTVCRSKTAKLTCGRESANLITE